MIWCQWHHIMISIIVAESPLGAHHPGMRTLFFCKFYRNFFVCEIFKEMKNSKIDMTSQRDHSKNSCLQIFCHAITFAENVILSIGFGLENWMSWRSHSQSSASTHENGTVGTVGYLDSRGKTGHLTHEMESLHFECTKFAKPCSERQNWNCRVLNAKTETAVCSSKLASNLFFSFLRKVFSSSFYEMLRLF